jgi:hypothetical protein
VNWTLGTVDVKANWRYALPVWILPSLAAEVVIRFMGGQIIGIIAGVGVSLIKSYYDFCLTMKEHLPTLLPKRDFWHIFLR